MTVSVTIARGGFLALVWLGASSCGDDSAPVSGLPVVDAAAPDAFVGPARALFELPRQDAPPPSGFFALPFPNDIRIREHTGTMDLDDYVRSNVLLGRYVDAIQQSVHGFSVTAASFLRFDGPIDPASLPASPQASQESTAAVYMVNIEPASPRYGERVPLRFRFEPRAGSVIGPNWLSALPFPGFVLAEQETYALVVTRRLQATDGSPVAMPAEFATVIEAAEPTGDVTLDRARSIYASLGAWLDQPGGDERDDVVVASVFTTQDATSLMGKIRQVIWDEVPQPRPRRVKRLLNGPNYAWFDGIFDSPNFQRGESPFLRMEHGGDIVCDPETGKPVVQRMEELRFSLTVPLAPMPGDGWPVVIFAHGTGGSYHSFRNSGTAELLAAEGLAVISTDQVMHEPRIPASGSPELLFFNFQNPLAVRDNTLQGALDGFQLLRLVREFDFTERRPGGLRIRFDRQRIYFFGHSQGGLTGPPFLAHEPEVKGAVFSGAGGLLYLSLLLKTEPFDIAGLIATLIDDYPLDEFNPVLALLQTYIDRSDPVVYGPLLVRNPVDGIAPKHIFQSEGFVDRYTPTPSIEALATSIGVDLIEPVLAPVTGLELTGGEILTPPLHGNRNGVTAVLLQYLQQEESDGHFVLFNVDAARRQSAAFLRTLADTGEATLVPPQ